MLNKFFIFYAGLMLTMVLTVMFLLISAEIADLSITKAEAVGMAINCPPENNVASSTSIPLSEVMIEDELIAKLEASDDSLIIKTDKTVYASNEPVKIIFESKMGDSLAQEFNSGIEIKARPDLGKNYEVALIEQDINGEWIAVEPVKRCSDDCSEYCKKSGGDGSVEKKEYVWDQTFKHCKDGKTELTAAPSGEYRISSAAWDKKSSANKIVSSAIFQISTKSKE